MKLFDYIRLFEHPGGVRIAIPTRITPVPERAAVLEADLKDAREYIAQREAQERKFWETVLFSRIALYGAQQKLADHFCPEGPDDIQSRQH